MAAGANLGPDALPTRAELVFLSTTEPLSCLPLLLLLLLPPLLPLQMPPQH
jgi:hypothetical protein